MRSVQIVKVAAAPMVQRKKSLPKIGANGSVQFVGVPSSSSDLGNGVPVIKKSVISVLTAAGAENATGTI